MRELARRLGETPPQKERRFLGVPPQAPLAEGSSLCIPGDAEPRSDSGERLAGVGIWRVVIGDAADNGGFAVVGSIRAEAGVLCEGGDGEVVRREVGGVVDELAEGDEADDEGDVQGGGDLAEGAEGVAPVVGV